MQVNEIWLMDFGPQYPAEPADYRPALVVGPPMGWQPTPNVVVVPFTTTGRGFTSYVEVEATQANGLRETSYLQCEQVRSVNQDRYVATLGVLPASDRFKVDLVLKKMLSLDREDR